MDDLKLSIYMEARRMIEEGEQGFVCCALQHATEDIAGLAFEEGGATLHAVLEEFFPEFFELHDGEYWSFDWELTGEKVFYGASELGKHSAWWVYEWKEPRLAIIDFIVNNR